MMVSVIVTMFMRVVVGAQGDERRGRGGEQRMRPIVLVMMVGMWMAMIVAVERRPRQSMRLAEGLVAAG